MHTTNVKIREFEEKVRSLGCCVTGALNDVQIHHVLGRKGKHNKVLVGPVFILPLHKDYHMETGDYQNAWHKNKKGFISEFGLPGKLFLHKVSEDFISKFGRDDYVRFVLPEQIEAIGDYRW